MKEFQLRFFGGLGLTLGDQDLTRPLSVKAQGLICYLACTGRPQTRLTLAGMFWSEKPESDALRSLRVDLTKIRKYLAPHIEITRLTLAFIDNGSQWIDTQTFEHHLRLVQDADGAAARTHLREAAQLYAGDFLAGYQPGDALGFEEWMIAEQERYRAKVLIALEKLVDINIDLNEYEAGIESANQILRIDPWREEAHRRLMWLYMKNGQRGAALRQYDNCRTVLENEMGVEPDPATVQLWQEIKKQTDGTGVVTQPLHLSRVDSEAEMPFQAPPEVPFFSGRDVELAQLKTQIEETSGIQVICAVGMGGVGKTSFVVEFAHQNRECFADGVLWANAANDPAMVAEQWAAAYNYDFRAIPKIKDRLLALRDLLSEKQALIIIDDVAVAARVKPLIPTEGASVVVCTARNADMAYALGAELFNLDVLTSLNGRSLLSSIIGQTRVQDDLVSSDAICQTLQNLPLALAIAGQYLVSRPKRGLTTFLGRLQQSALLDVADNEGVVRASFDISWAALDQVQQRVFALVALFNGRSFSAEAMAHIADIDFYVMQDQLDTLSTRSLLIEQGSDYYRQHALLAHFADEKLKNKQSPFQRLVSYFSAYTDSYSSDYQKLRNEWDNLDAAIQTMADQGLWQTLFRVNQNLNQAWFAQGLFERARIAYQMSYEGALIVEDAAQIGESLFWQGMTVVEQGGYEEARALFERALTTFEEMEDVVSVSDVEYHLARTHLFQSNYDEVARLLDHSLLIKQKLNDQVSIGQIKYRQLMLMSRLAKYDLALQVGNEALLIQEQTHSQLDLVRTLRELSLVYCMIKEYEQARLCGEKGLHLVEELNDVGELTGVLYALAYLNWQTNGFDEALTQARRSLTLLEQFGDIASQANVLLLICGVLRDVNEYEDSLSYGKRALAFFRQVSDISGVARTLANLGTTYFFAGERELARENWLAGRKIAKEINHTYLISGIDARLVEAGVIPPP